MKKLIAILAVFALLTGSVFAQASIGGSVGMGAILVDLDSSDKGKDDPNVYTSMNAHWGSLNFNWASDDNTAGGKIKVNGDFNKNGDAGSPLIGGRVWWQPIEFFRVEFTNLEDEGVMGRGNAIDWGYQSNSAADSVTNLWGASGWNSFSNGTLRTGHGFFEGIGGGGENVLMLSAYPISGLAINVAWGLPYANDPVRFQQDIVDVMKRTLAQVTYDISGIGNFGVHYQGRRGAGYYGWLQSQVIGVDFTLTALSGMNIEISGLIPVGDVYDWGGNDWDGGKPEWVADTLPIEIGLGFAMNQWSGDAFKLFARAGVLLPNDDFKNTAIALDVNPSYDLGWFRVYADLGIAVVIPDDGDVDFFWHANPYIRKGLGIGDLYFGINLWNGTLRDGYEVYPSLMGKDSTEIINFAVPIYFEISF